MTQNQHEIDKITQRSLTDETSQVNDFIRDLKAAGANPGTTMNILTKKLGLNSSQSKELVFASPSWRHLDPRDNPFTEEFLKVVAADANEVKIVDGKIVSFKINLDMDSDENGK
jgi:hypothetical protein